MELHDQWLEKATRDVRTASLLLESDESLLDMVVYHAQQCAEKALKAFIAYLGKQVPKSHDLSQLVQQCALESSSFTELFFMADILTPYGIAFRYPSELLEPDRFDAEEAVRFAKCILEFVEQHLDSCNANMNEA